MDDTQFPFFMYNSQRIHLVYSREGLITRKRNANLGDFDMYDTNDTDPYLIPGDGIVMGEVFDVNHHAYSTFMKQMDEYNRMSSDGTVRRRLMDVMTDEGVIKAWVYTERRPHIDLLMKPEFDFITGKITKIESGDWIEFLTTVHQTV